MNNQDFIKVKTLFDIANTELKRISKKYEGKECRVQYSTSFAEINYLAKIEKIDNPDIIKVRKLREDTIVNVVLEDIVEIFDEDD